MSRCSNVVLKVSPTTVTLLSHTLRFPFTANDIARLPFFNDIQGLQIHIHWQPMMTRYATGYRLSHNQTFEEYWQLRQDLLQNIQILCEALTSLTNPPKIRLAFTRYELRTATICTMPRPSLRQAFLKPFEALAATLPQGRIEISYRNAQLEDLMRDGYRWWTPLMRRYLDAPTLRMLITEKMGEIMARQRYLWDEAVRSGGTIMLCDLTGGH